VLLFATAQYEIEKLVGASRLKDSKSNCCLHLQGILSGEEFWDTMKTEAAIMMLRRDVNYHEDGGCKLF
jgi:hypothetical protein